MPTPEFEFNYLGDVITILLEQRSGSRYRRCRARIGAGRLVRSAVGRLLSHGLRWCFPARWSFPGPLPDNPGGFVCFTNFGSMI